MTPPVAGNAFGLPLSFRRPIFLVVRMQTDHDLRRPVAIVMGTNDIGSAIAVVLQRAGYAVVLCDDVDPAWMRRGMSFANAWYIGNSELGEEAALFCASVKSLPAVLDRRRLIAATTWSWTAVAAVLQPVAVVDATPRWRQEDAMFKSRLPDEVLAVGIGPAHAGHADVDVVVEPDCSDEAGAVPHALVRARRSGRFATRGRIGDRVREGELIGAVGELSVRAPEDGVLRGLSAHGARITEGAEILEVDPRGDPVLCFGIEERALAVGHAVRRAMASRDLVPLATATAFPELSGSRYRVPRQG